MSIISKIKNLFKSKETKLAEAAALKAVRTKIIAKVKNKK